jgi:hypothetical protein
MAIATVHLISSLGTTATILTSDLCMKTISLTTSGIITVGKSLLTQNSSYIDLSSLQKIENKLDLLETIRIYDLWVKDVLVQNKSEIEQSSSLKEVINSFINVLEELHNILKSIDDKVANHKLKWFYSYRGLDFSAELDEIQTKKIALDNRFNMIQKLYTFNRL